MKKRHLIKGIRNAKNFKYEDRKLAQSINLYEMLEVG